MQLLKITGTKSKLQSWWLTYTQSLTASAYPVCPILARQLVKKLSYLFKGNEGVAFG